MQTDARHCGAVCLEAETKGSLARYCGRWRSVETWAWAFVARIQPGEEWRLPLIPPVNPDLLGVRILLAMSKATIRTFNLHRLADFQPVAEGAGVITQCLIWKVMVRSSRSALAIVKGCALPSRRRLRSELAGTMPSPAIAELATYRRNIRKQAVRSPRRPHSPGVCARCGRPVNAGHHRFRPQMSVARRIYLAGPVICRRMTCMQRQHQIKSMGMARCVSRQGGFCRGKRFIA